jgi:hypothetical protein
MENRSEQKSNIVLGIQVTRTERFRTPKEKWEEHLHLEALGTEKKETTFLIICDDDERETFILKWHI